MKIKLKKKQKLKFVFKNSSSNLKRKKDYIGNSSPSENRYEELIEEYSDDPDFITALGIKIFPSGEQFVKDAYTGRIITRTKETRYLGRDEDSGFHFYLGEGSTFTEEDKAHPSFIKEEI